MTNTVFEITSMGLQINGRMIMPGSRLVIKGAPHTTWNAVGRIAGTVTEKRLEVASPSVAPAQEDNSELDAVKADYERITGKKPHHKAKLETLLEAIEAHTPTEQDAE